MVVAPPAFDGLPLSGRRRDVKLCDVVERRDVAVAGEIAKLFFNAILKTRAPSDDHTDADCAIGVETVEVFQIPIEKRILIVPFDFDGDGATGKILDVIDFVGA